MRQRRPPRRRGRLRLPVRRPYLLDDRRSPSVPLARKIRNMNPPDEGTVLDRRTLNRTFLARQWLIDRVAVPVEAAIEHLVGMQAQVPTDPYVSLWSRLRDFDPVDLERLLLEREAVRMSLMRSTLHLVTRRDALALQPVMEVVARRGF